MASDLITDEPLLSITICYLVWGFGYGSVYGLSSSLTNSTYLFGIYGGFGCDLVVGDTFYMGSSKSGSISI
jgi:hypothetical protein